MRRGEPALLEEVTMQADWERSDCDAEPTPDERLDSMRSTLALHRELIGQKAEIREQPDNLSAQLEAMEEELDADDPTHEAIRLLLKVEQVRAMQIEELDQRIDQLTDSFMVGSIALLERLRPPGV
jgi:hypothetical protein